jgi:GxxExxY protein
MRINELTYQIIGSAIEVHRELGPGKSEAAYEAALAHELGLRDLAHSVQRPVPVVYKGLKLDCGYRLDVLVEEAVVAEVKSVEAVIPIHRAQVLTYLRLGGWRVGLLLNFNVAVLKEGIQRLVLSLDRDVDAARQGLAPGTSTDQTSEGSTGLHSKTDSGDAEAERLANVTLDAAAEVHRWLGPGLLPSAYEGCLCHELLLRGVPVERKRGLALSYKGHPLPGADEVEILAGDRLVVKPQALIAMEPVHEAALLSQLRLGGWSLGLLINFHTTNFAEGLRRVVRSGRREEPQRRGMERPKTKETAR